MVALMRCSDNLVLKKRVPQSSHTVRSGLWMVALVRCSDNLVLKKRVSHGQVRVVDGRTDAM